MLPHRSQTYRVRRKYVALDYSKAAPGTYPTCQNNPALADLLLAEGHRLAIKVKDGQPEPPGEGATYWAGLCRLRSIMIKQRPMSPEVRCTLISHESIHVLQHLEGGFAGSSTSGLDNLHPDPISQEAVAYGHQQRPGYVLTLLQQTERPD